MRFIWDGDKADENERSHDVSFFEAQDSFRDPYAIEEYDASHSEDESRFILVGHSGRHLLMVVFAIPDADTIRIISALKAEAKFRKAYEKQKKHDS